jgi:prepilin-type N-terminal cleavage/methylation domain-containing protein
MHSLSKKHSWFTLTELIVVITILSILSVIGFTVMSHQSSVARDGKRISDIKTLSESARITSAQLRKLPTPIADSVSLTVSGTFIGYQGFMSLALVNPLGYGSDKIFDPKDNIPYTYRVNQHYDQAQFLAYLENPRFERTIEIAKQSLPSTLPDTLFASDSLFSSDSFFTSDSLLVSKAYALDTSSIDLSKRYPYSAGDRLWIFLSKGSKQPLQNGVTGTGSRDISLSDASTLDIIVGSQWADEYVSTDISTGSLNALKSGTFDEKALLGMNSGTGSNGSSTGSNSGGGNNGWSSSGYILTMGEYSLGWSPVYGYVGPNLLSLFGPSITMMTAWDLTPKTIEWKTIDSIVFFGWMQFIFIDTNSGIATIRMGEWSNTADCTPNGVLGSVDQYVCSSVSVSPVYTPGEVRSIGIQMWTPEPQDTCGLTPGEVANLNNLTELSKTAEAWCATTNLTFPANSITSLPTELFKLKNLTNLNASNNGITEVPTSISQLNHLIYLYVTDNTITTLPDELFSITSLQVLDIQNNSLTTLSESLGNLSNLTTLSLSGNPIASLPNSISNLYALQNLNVRNNHLSTLPSSFENLNQLQILDLRSELWWDDLGNLNNYWSHGYTSNNGTHSQEWIPWINDITIISTDGGVHPIHIDMHEDIRPDCSLNSAEVYALNSYIDTSYYPNSNNRSAKDWCEQVNTNLINLGYYGTWDSLTIDALNGISKLATLETVNLSGYGFIIPEEFGNLSNLKHFFAMNITWLPTSFGNLSHLETFTVYQGGFTSLPESFGNLNALKSIEMSYVTNLTGLPNSIGNLSNLQSLKITWADYGYEWHISSLPDSISNLSNLQELDLSYNFINSLPNLIGNLSNLRTLKLVGNNLSSLPASFVNLSNLEILDLSARTTGSLGNLQRNFDTTDTNVYTQYSIPSIDQKMMITGNGNSKFIVQVGADERSDCGLTSGEVDDLNALMEILNPAHYGARDWCTTISLNLTYKNISQTLFTTITKLINLEQLILQYNSLTTLPGSIVNLTHLKQLWLQDNPWLWQIGVYHGGFVSQTRTQTGIPSTGRKTTIVSPGDNTALQIIIEDE